MNNGGIEKSTFITGILSAIGEDGLLSLQQSIAERGKLLRLIVNAKEDELRASQQAGGG